VPEEEWVARIVESRDMFANHVGTGRELFGVFRASVSTAEEGAATFGLPPVPAGMQQENQSTSQEKIQKGEKAHP
jgi:phosphogluconate dehydratase